MGIPVIGCSCETCTSSDKKNKRYRPSVLLTAGEKRFLVDIGPDYRAQALKYGIDTLDGLIVTHSHYDHIAGLDELRIYTFRQKRPVPCLLSRETYEELKVRYHYFLPKDSVHDTKLKFSILDEESGKTMFQALNVEYFSYIQIGMKVNGFRFNNLAYVTDIMEYDESIFDSLKGLDTLILSGRRWEKSVAHLSIGEGIDFAKKNRCEKNIFYAHFS